ncbi:hypothetical protein Tco_0968809 [Tanacetum coccineum]
MVESVEARISLIKLEFSSCLFADSPINLLRVSSIDCLHSWYEGFACSVGGIPEQLLYIPLLERCTKLSVISFSFPSSLVYEQCQRLSNVQLKDIGKALASLGSTSNIRDWNKSNDLKTFLNIVRIAFFMIRTLKVLSLVLDNWPFSSKFILVLDLGLATPILESKISGSRFNQYLVSLCFLKASRILVPDP